MNIGNLRNNMVVKNYKELCNILEIPIVSGNSKLKQLKELELYCTYYKQGNKIIIDKLREKPKVKPINKNSKYIELIGDILVNYLYAECKNTGYNITLSLGNIMEIVGLVNSNYAVGNRHKKELSQILNVNILSVYYFYNTTKGEFKNIIERALKSLQNRRVLFYKQVKTICIKEGNCKKYIVADTEQEQEILNIEKQVLREMGYNNLSKLWLSGKIKTFQRKVKKLMPVDWIYYFNSYNLNIGDVALEIEYNSIKETKEKLNNKSIEKVEKSLKINDTEQDEKILIDELVSLIVYDIQTADDIINKYYENMKIKNEKINKKYEDMQLIANEIEEIKEEDQISIDIVDYISYINKRNCNYNKIEKFSEEIELKEVPF